MTITVDDAISELGNAVEDAHHFMSSEFLSDWNDGELYAKGGCDLPTLEGRSTVVKTETRDSIRAVMPNIMRTLYQSKKPVEYQPSNMYQASVVDQQGLWIAQHFHAQGGYRTLYDAVLQACKLKAGPIKTFWLEEPEPEYIRATGLNRQELYAYTDDPDVEVLEIEARQSATHGELFDIEAVRKHEFGKICFESFPIYEFFVARDATNLDDYLHGHRRSVTASEAEQMGLDADWSKFDDDDPEDNDFAQPTEIKRGYTTDQDMDMEADPANHRFLLTEAYCRYDLDGDGIAERYVFYFGGSTYAYIHHERVSDFCIDIVCIDPIPHSVIGHSIVDLTKQSTDNQTSLLRAMMDNAHQANNPRFAADPARTNFADLMNNSLGAPVKTRGAPEVQVIDTPSTAQQTLPLLAWFERDAETRVGVTKAAQGLDPDAMQSTDKDAVLNTISLSQGQIELIVRNVVETGLIPLFRKAMKLAVRHMPKDQIVQHKGVVLPFNLGALDPDLMAVPNVGLGTQSAQMQMQTLNLLMQKQEQYMQQYGLDNPFVTLSQMFNAMQDFAELGGVRNIGRYFNFVGVDQESAIAQNLMAAKAAQAEAQKTHMPLDIGKASVMVESIRARGKHLEVMNDRATAEAKLSFEALKTAEEMDLDRDRLAQQGIIDLVKLGRENMIKELEEVRNETRPEPLGQPATERDDDGGVPNQNPPSEGAVARE